MLGVSAGDEKTYRRVKQFEFIFELSRKFKTESDNSTWGSSLLKSDNN